MTAKERAKLMCDQFETQDLPDGTSIVTFANQLVTGAIEAVILEEREACKQIAKNYVKQPTDDSWSKDTCDGIAEAVEKRGHP